jgi:hypothetical protein
MAERARPTAGVPRISGLHSMRLLPRGVCENRVYQPPMPGRATAQAVSRCLLIAAARVRTRVRSCGICGGQSGTATGFLRVLRFPQPILILPTSPHSSYIVRGWYNRPVSGRRTKWSLTPPQETKKKTYL